MSRIITTDLLNVLNRHFVGMDMLSRYLHDDVDTVLKSSTYPPANIEQLDDNTYVITLAVAGYTQDDLTINYENRVLTVIGNKSSETSGQYLYKGIANREFKRSFVLDSWIEIDGIVLENGMLTIKLVREIPDAMKPRSIPIGYNRTVSVEAVDALPETKAKKSK